MSTHHFPVEHDVDSEPKIPEVHPVLNVLVARLQQNGWSAAHVEAALPASEYFHLRSPFSDTFDFDHPLNTAWASTIHEPALRRLASKPDAPGCAGVPALAKARAEACEP